MYKPPHISSLSWLAAVAHSFRACFPELCSHRFSLSPAHVVVIPMEQCRFPISNRGAAHLRVLETEAAVVVTGSRNDRPSMDVSCGSCPDHDPRPQTVACLLVGPCLPVPRRPSGMIRAARFLDRGKRANRFRNQVSVSYPDGAIALRLPAGWGDTQNPTTTCVSRCRPHLCE
ncbi:hypothetical protein B0J18DRAFT_134255 [Chaetomium sp. MPI-SDFR-AT-0129]|nr:hypothetical protein B0J18DRAFT_134255 [Chaetomium sp. MPI-SDFR-AT-0129]